MAYTFYMLAERARTPVVLAALASIAALAFAFAMRSEEPRATAPEPIIISITVPVDMPPVQLARTDFCPPHVRASIHLGVDATLYCVRGEFPEPGTFVFAIYETTETWERFAVVADDGHLIVPMLDRPRLAAAVKVE